MTVDATSPRSRRALLAGTVGALAAMAAQAMGRPLPAAAGGGAVILGATNTTDGLSTDIDRADVRTSAHFASSNHGVGGVGTRDGTIGVWGHAAGAVHATAMEGVTDGYNYQVAVHADTTDGFGEGIAVKAETKNGIAVQASATGGAALVATGVTEFSRSGKASFTTGQASRTLTAGRVTTDTIVVATIQGAVPGVYVLGAAVNVARQNFTIKLNKAAPKGMTVGWFIVN